MRQIPACAGMTGVLRGFEDDKNWRWAREVPG